MRFLQKKISVIPSEFWTRSPSVICLRIALWIPLKTSAGIRSGTSSRIHPENPTRIPSELSENPLTTKDFSRFLLKNAQ